MNRIGNRLTKNGRRKGRPPKHLGPAVLEQPIPAQFRRPTSKRYLVRLRDPNPVRGADGVAREALGPPRPIYEIRQIQRGRPPGSKRGDTLDIIEAIAGRNVAGHAQRLAEESKRSVETVKRKIARTRAEIRERAMRLNAKPKRVRGIQDFPLER